jgi:uncharacterized damage-inducible protein DinB
MANDLNTPEKETLARYLDTYRAVVVWKLDGVGRDDAIRPMVRSGTSLAGIVKHLAYVERWWFQAVVGGRDVEFPGGEEDPDADWRLEPEETVEDIVALYRRECDVSRTIVDDLDSLDDTFSDDQISARRILIHMVEETARHAGHADILRELIDGATGWGPPTR